LASDAEEAYAISQGQELQVGGHIVSGRLRAMRDGVSHVVFRKPSLQQLRSGKIEKFDFLGVWDTVRTPMASDRGDHPRPSDYWRNGRFDARPRS